MGSWGAIIGRRPLPVLMLGLLLALLGAIYGGGLFGHLSGGGFDDPYGESARQARAAAQVFGNHAPDVVLAYGDPDRPATDRAVRAEVERVVAGYPRGAVERVVTGYQAHDPMMFSRDGHRVQVVISLAGDGDAARAEHYRELSDALRATNLRTLVTGPYTVAAQGSGFAARDLRRAQLLSIPLILVGSLLISGGMIAALMPLLAGVIAVAGTLALTRLITGAAAVSVFSVTVIVFIGLGLAVNYALFIVSRFRKELRGSGADVVAATRETMRRAGPAVVFSGLSMAAALGSLAVFPQEVLRSLAYGGSAAVLVAVLTSLTVLPATLALLGRRIDIGAIPLLGQRRGGGARHEAGGWERWARAVLRRPGSITVAALVLLLALGLPFLGVRWDGYDYRTLPQDTRAHQEAALMAKAFVPQTSAAVVTVAGVNEEGAEVFFTRARGVGTVTDVRATARVGDVVLVRVTWLGAAQSQQSRSIVAQLRALPRPDTARAVAVGGRAAAAVDTAASIGARLPAMAGVLIVATVVLLFLVFGSVAAPLLAIAAAVAALLASLGVLTWAMSGGDPAAPWIRLGSGGLNPVVTVAVFAVGFGLSVHYAVFQLARIRDRWHVTGDTTESIAAGLAGTGRNSLGAALLLAGLAAAFASSSMMYVRDFGLGVVVVLVLDATLIRPLLVPAVMTLLGPRCWWAPALLRRS